MVTAPVHFYERVDRAIADVKLQRALDRHTHHYIEARRQALDEMLDPDGVRDRARAIRAEALAHLDQYLEQLAANVEARGGHVHWAADSASARNYIVGLARDRGVRTIVKSKSMASEEIHLNHALEAQGMNVVETDLGEYIIQLAGETPSHIVAPVIHKTKEQVAELFVQKLGMPPTDDAQVITRTARARLRQAFLTADMGISGVNFGVAETGTVVTVTNEGNARLTTTTPRIHVAMMGIERLVPTVDDLLVMLQVLARSATGQRLSVYTTLVTGPARPGEPDGPDEFHLVLLDNGRSRILGSDYAEALLCIRCGACLNHCPVYQEIGGHAYGAVYSGPIGAVLTPLFEGINEETRYLPQASSLCGACKEACPVRIDIPRMLLRLRYDTVEQGKAPEVERGQLAGWRLAMSSPGLYALGGKIARQVLRPLTRDGRVRRLPPPFNAWTRSRDFPPFAPQSFQERWAARHDRGGTARSDQRTPTKEASR